MDKLSKALQNNRLLVVRRTLELEGNPATYSVLKAIAGAESFYTIDEILRESERVKAGIFQRAYKTQEVNTVSRGNEGVVTGKIPIENDKVEPASSGQVPHLDSAIRSSGWFRKRVSNLVRRVFRIG